MHTLAWLGYTGGHETTWEAQPAGEAQTAGDRPPPSGTTVPGRGAHGEGLVEFGGAMGPGLPEERAEWLARPAGAGPAGPVVPEAARPVETAAGPGRGKGGLFDRRVDVATDRQADQTGVQGALHHRGRLEADAHGPRVELAETGAPGHRAGRGRHRTLETGHLAPYKKTPNDVGPIWRSSTKAGFCSSLTCARPGRPGATPRFCATAISATGFPPSPASRSHRPIGAWGCMYSSTPPTSPGSRSSTSSVISCGISADKWSCSGMGVPFTSGKWSGTSSSTGLGSMCIPSPLMPQSSTPMSLSGPRPSVTCPMAPPKTLGTSRSAFAAQPEDSDDRRDFSGRASFSQTSHGHGRG